MSLYSGKEYWKNYMELYFGKDLVGKWTDYAAIETIESCGRRLNLEIYDTGDPVAPTLVFSHGIAGYARVLLPFLIPLREKGYNIIAPDLTGYGYNEGTKGDFEWNIHVQNLCDTVEYSKKRFQGKILVGGASMGGPLAYAAACRCDGLAALVCWCLWDLSDTEYVRNETATKGLTYILLPFLKILSKIWGRLRIKTYALISYDTLTDSPEFNALIKKDPQAGTHITLNGAVSILLQSKMPLPFDAFSLPVLVVQPGSDRMTPAKYAKKAFARIGSRRKRYIELAGAAHFPIQRAYYHTWADEFDTFINNL